MQPKDSNLKRNLSDLRDALKPVLLSRYIESEAKKHSKSAKSDKINLLRLVYDKIKEIAISNYTKEKV